MKNNSGFTSMELLTVIAIIGIISAITIPNLIAWRSNHQLNGSAREVMSFINGARIEAVKNNATVNVAIDATDRKITSQYNNRAVTGSSVEKELFLNPGINIDSTTFTGNTFSFNSRGLPGNPGTIVLEKSDGDTLSVVMALTGITRIE